jgi:hypothetical protein
MKTKFYKYHYGTWKPNGFIVEKEETKSKVNDVKKTIPVRKD